MNDYVNDYTVVMAWYDVREREQNPLREIRHNNEFVLAPEYIERSKLYIEKDIPIILFTEPQYVDTFWKIRPQHLHDRTRIICKPFEDLYMFTELFPRFEENHRQNPVQNLHREKFTALYNFVVNQKTELVREACELNPFSSTVFAWMDLRLYDMSVGELAEIFGSIPCDRVIITQTWYSEITEVTNRRHWYESTRGKVCAGFFAGHREPLIRFADLCRRELHHAANIGTCPTDEMIYSVVVAENLELFEPHIGDYPDVLHNVLYHRQNIFFSIGYLKWVYQKGNFYYVHKIAENIRKGYWKHTVGLGTEDMHTVWYYNIVACTWLDKPEMCCELLNEYYDIIAKRSDLLAYVKRIYYTNIRQDIGSINGVIDAGIMKEYDELLGFSEPGSPNSGSDSFLREP